MRSPSPARPMRAVLDGSGMVFPFRVRELRAILFPCVSRELTSRLNVYVVPEVKVTPERSIEKLAGPSPVASITVSEPENGVSVSIPSVQVYSFSAPN